MTVKGLSVRHAPLVARMLFWRLTLPIAKRLVATERLVRLLATSPHRAGQPKDLSTAVRIAGRLWRSADGPCLDRSLALYHELGRLGAHPELVLGMARNKDRLVGHAWVELERRPLLESYDPAGFSAIVRFDREGVHAEGAPTG